MICFNQFLGVWYQVQPGIDSDDQNEPETPSCEYYNITNSNRPNLYIVNEMIEIYARFEGNTPLQYESTSMSYLNAFNGYVPASMQMRPPFGKILQPLLFFIKKMIDKN